MNRVMLHRDTTIHLTTFLLNFPFDMTLMSGTLSGQYHKVTRSYIGSKAANNFVLPTKDVSLFFFFIRNFNNIMSQDTIFSSHFIFVHSKTLQDEILKSVFGTDVHFLNLNSKIFNFKTLCQL